MARLMYIKVLFFCQIFVIIDGNTHGISNSEVKIYDIKENPIPISTRIVGGYPTNIKTYPFVVSVQWRISSTHHCGGTYILPRFVLSAAHCMVRFYGNRWRPENPKFFMILAGSSNLWYSPTWQIAVTDAALPHPEFDLSSMAHDIGLFRINKAFRLTPYVGFANLPLGSIEDALMQGNQTCMVIGWGKTSEAHAGTSDVLRHVEVPLISTKECNQYFTYYLHPSQICAGKKEGGVDACQGDSGGPLICGGVQFGIVSWGYGCAAPKSPGVYTRVDFYITWIYQTTLKNGVRSNIFHDFASNYFLPLVTIFLHWQ